MVDVELQPHESLWSLALKNTLGRNPNMMMPSCSDDRIRPVSGHSCMHDQEAVITLLVTGKTCPSQDSVLTTQPQPQERV